MKSTGSLLLAVILMSASALAQAGRRISLEDAVSEARHQGRVLSAETDRRGGRESYRIRILTKDGRVKRLRVDPESGRVQRGKNR